MPIISRGTELGSIGEIVPGAVQSGNCTPIARIGGGGGGTPVPPTPPSVDTDAGAVGAVFQNQTTAIEVASGGVVYVRTAKTIKSVVCGFLPGLTDSIQFDIWLSTYAGMPTINTPNSICGGNYPTISAANESQDAALVGWNTSIPADSWIGFYCRSRNTPRWAVVQLETEEAA